MSLLFEPASLGQMSLRNRLVKSATLENMATLEGLPTGETLRFYERLAGGGVGLIITGLTYVNQAGQVGPLQHGIHTDAVIPEWQRITEAVHERGARIAMQIVHAGRQTQAKALNGRRSLGPSAIPNPLYFTRSRRMTEEQIWETVRDFGSAAARVKAAGFDAVQIHAAHGYLISSFLSPLTNRRRDAWGGDPERRLRFLLEVYGSVRQAVGDDFPVLCKLNVDDFVWVGLTPKHAFAVARRLAEHRLDALEMSGGIYETILNMSRGGAPVEIIARHRSPLMRLCLEIAFRMQRPRTRFKEVYFLPQVAKLKKDLNIPLILIGGIRRPDLAEQVLESGQADFISMARPLIREPDLPNKWLAGSRDAAQCGSCNRCLGELEQGSRLRCYSKNSKP